MEGEKDVGVNSRDQRLNYAKIAKAESSFIMSITEIINSDKNSTVFQKVNHERDKELKELKDQKNSDINFMKSEIVENFELEDEDEDEHDNQIDHNNMPPDYKPIDIPVFMMPQPLKISHGIDRKEKNRKPKNLQGFLKKRSGNFLMGWQQRWCRLQDRVFWYYDSKSSTTPSGILNFDQLTINLKVYQEEPKFSIYIVGSDKVFDFRANSINSRDKWVRYIKAHFERALGSKLKLTTAAKIPKFWRIPQIGNNEFLQRADTGDILLFKTNNIAAQAQRIATNSEYDHVAVLLKYDDNEIVLLEATGNSGVSLCRWSFFVKNEWHLLYPKLVWRQLETVRDENFINGIEEFVKENYGKTYELTAEKLMKKQSILPTANQKKKYDSFFCSQLVAAAYKHVGILPKELSTTQYWPVTFSQKQNLQLTGGAKLGIEMLINFKL